MGRTIMAYRLGSMVFLGLLVALRLMPVYAEEATVKATAAWQGQGHFFQVQEKLALFVGAFSGTMAIEPTPGALDAAQMLCPGMLEVNLTDGAQSGEGRCIMEARSGERVYATWNCTGIHLAGCRGTFTLVGGTGKLKDITGGGDFQIRSDVVEYAAKLQGDRVEAAAVGVAEWPALKYKLP
jgi:hypothetical protein